MKNLYRLLLIVLFTNLSFAAAKAQITATTSQQLEESISHRASLKDRSIFKNYPIRSVGPTVMSGRVADIAVHPDNSRIYYVGYASGGVFKTTNSGNTIEPVFDHQGALTVGDLAISRANPNVIWVGTGENNSSRSTYAGAGVYKSTDAGKSWEFSGLRHSQHIGRIVTHPTNENIAWVASIGALYTANEERGVFKTTDGGKTWDRTLFVNDSTGVIDLVIHPTDPNTLWAASWERDRKAWDFKEGGEGSAIYKSTDGGETWEKAVKGLPQGDFVGRIGLDISLSNPNVLYAIVDNQFETREELVENTNRYSQTTFTDISDSDFAKLDDKKLDQYLRNNGFPAKYTAKRVKEDVANNVYKPVALAEFLGDANAALFNTNIEGAEIYKSTNGGSSWKKVNSYGLDGVYNTYGYYFGQIRVDPNDPETIYIWGVPFLKSTDGGRTWKPKAENQPVHVDHHALWINPNDSEHLLLGNDGGLYESHDGGTNFIHHNVTSVGQFYAVSVDMEQPYNIYGGLQDNGTFYGSSRTVPNRSAEWERLFGGDGMHVYPDTRNPQTVYVGFQYGNYFRLDRDKNETTRITPRHDVGEDRYRYNWNAPIALSHHNQDIVYFGSQRLSRSLDRGNTWQAISPDLTHNLPNGDVPYSTLTTIAESPLKFDVIWTGSDDGRVHITRNGGNTWADVTEGLPERRWISEVHASKYDEATAYVSLNGFRNDEFKTHIYKTTDYGRTWSSISGNLPDEVVNVILQDPINPNILYAGLDHGTYVSFNDGGEWHYLSTLPNVATYDLVVHPRDLELVIGTHGRSIWVMDVKPLHVVANNLNDGVIAFQPSPIRYSPAWGRQNVQYREAFLPNVEFMYFLGDNKTNQSVTISVMDKEGKKVTDLRTSGDHGFNTFNWDLIVKKANGNKPAQFLGRGEYTLIFKSSSSTNEVTFKIN